MWWRRSSSNLGRCYVSEHLYLYSKNKFIDQIINSFFPQRRETKKERTIINTQEGREGGGTVTERALSFFPLCTSVFSNLCNRNTLAHFWYSCFLSCKGSFMYSTANIFVFAQCWAPCSALHRLESLQYSVSHVLSPHPSSEEPGAQRPIR